MKKCLNCERIFCSDEWQCGICGFHPDCSAGGIPLFAPDLASENDGFEPRYFEKLVNLEQGNFWFESRNKLIIGILKKYAKKQSKYLEIGCGTGFVLKGVSHSMPEFKITATDIYIDGLEFAFSRANADVNIIQSDARAIPYLEHFDVIGAYDCIEHITEDERALEQMFNAVKPEGIVVLTVPQHPFLWSNTDERSKHKRRYTRMELQTKLKNAGFDVIRSTSFTVFLFPLMVLARLAERHTQSFCRESATDGMHLHPVVNWLLRKIMNFEVALSNCGMDIPFGGSILMVGKKK